MVLFMALCVFDGLFILTNCWLQSSVSVSGEEWHCPNWALFLPQVSRMLFWSSLNCNPCVSDGQNCKAATNFPSLGLGLRLRLGFWTATGAVLCFSHAESDGFIRSIVHTTCISQCCTYHPYVVELYTWYVLACVLLFTYLFILFQPSQFIKRLKHSSDDLLFERFRRLRLRRRLYVVEIAAKQEENKRTLKAPKAPLKINTWVCRTHCSTISSIYLDSSNLKKQNLKWKQPRKATNIQMRPLIQQTPQM